MTLLQRATEFATRTHAGQVRKYTGEDYVQHPIQVSRLVATVPHTEAMLIAAVLHDTVGDTSTTLREIEGSFGFDVATLVEMLTDVSHPHDGVRSTRKAIDRAHTALASPEAKTIKLADLLDNTRSITEHDPEFAKVYMAEKRLLLGVLEEGDRTLWLLADECCRRFEEGVQ
jgi:(p)ppGpp synthase/HD superfamily hydrolase